MNRIRVWACVSLAFVLIFPLPILSARGPQEIPCAWTGVERIVAVGDLHGDYDAFVAILKAVNLVNDRLSWIGGKTHLVQMGDVLDRGYDARKIFDLIKRLEKEAGKAGGFVHLIIGNHEEMNITGLSFEFPEYVTVKEFTSFLPLEYRSTMEEQFRRTHGVQADITPFWEGLMKDPQARDIYVENFNRLYGRWIAEHNATIKINETVFVHGGFNEKYSEMKIEDINNLYRAEFQKIFRGESFKPVILFVADGPLWNRDMAQENPVEYAPTVDKILANLGARHLVIAHTPQLITENMSRYRGKVWITDTGISWVYRKSGGHLSALIIENGDFSAWWGS